ncbi:hypothetical protein [Dysgonomonas sp. 520]|uniref:hypothetical protein n=1 Tax=Dysgonomonas sp. 520 TaxID=2302931 RepID=UPI0013D0F903|nr:hypothetical protein [Dysgonomonas sp. 520]
MIKIKIEDIEYNIPNSYSDVKLADYEKWFGTEIENKEDEVVFVSKVSGIDVNTLQNLPLSFYNDLVGIISFSLKDSIKEAKNSIEIDGITYTINNEEELTLAEWIDVEESLKSDEDKLSKILAVVCRPVGETYDTNRLADRIELFKGLTMDKLFPLFNFFLLLKERYNQIMNHYSMVQELQNQLHQLTEISQKNGVGTKWWHNLRTMIYNKWIGFLHWALSRCSTSFRFKLINKMQKKLIRNS